MLVISLQNFHVQNSQHSQIKWRYRYLRPYLLLPLLCVCESVCWQGSSLKAYLVLFEISVQPLTVRTLFSTPQEKAITVRPSVNKPAACLCSSQLRTCCNSFFMVISHNQIMPRKCSEGEKKKKKLALTSYGINKRRRGLVRKQGKWKCFSGGVLIKKLWTDES